METCCLLRHADPSTTCPSGWQLTGYSKKTCVSITTVMRTCDSAICPVRGGEYTKVCGRTKTLAVPKPSLYGHSSSGESPFVVAAHTCETSATYFVPTRGRAYRTYPAFPRARCESRIVNITRGPRIHDGA